MNNFSFPELIFSAALVLIFSAYIGLPLLLRLIFPQKMWVGILLSLFFIPFGQLYISGGMYWFLGLGLLEILAATFKSGLFFSLLAFLASPVIMYFRMAKENERVSPRSSGTPIAENRGHAGD